MQEKEKHRPVFHEELFDAAYISKKTHDYIDDRSRMTKVTCPLPINKYIYLHFYICKII